MFLLFYSVHPSDMQQKMEESSFYPRMSKQSEKIVQQYKHDNEKAAKKCLDESYNSLGSSSQEDGKLYIITP
jgi:hypothetical protein